MKEFIRLTDISTNSGTHTNLNHCYFSIASGQIIYLAGLHGSGKSTLKDVLCGNLAISSGGISIENVPLSCLSSQQARQAGIFSIENSNPPLISSLSIYENMEIYSSTSDSRSKKILFNRKESIERTADFLSEFNLSINPSTQIQDLSENDRFLLYILAAAYSNAKLIILNLSTLKLSFLHMQKLFRILHQINLEGTALLLICDFYRAYDLNGDICIFRNGRIVKEFDSASTSAQYINSLLLSKDFALPVLSDPLPNSGHIIGILELCYSNYSLADYLLNLGLVTGEALKSIDNTSIKFLKSSSMDCLCSNLSISENIAMVRYPEIAERNGTISNPLLQYIEKEFFKLLEDYNIAPAAGINTLSTAAKKILIIERWIMAGVKRLAVEDPLFGLDVAGQNTLLKYFWDLKKRNIQLIFIFYNVSELQTICDTVHICKHGKINDSVLKESNLRLEDVLPK